ncbi:MAG: hypothetical protein ABL962_13915 [Fimbriimonadaceae bacterium]
MDEIVFGGKVVNGRGGHAELFVPGRSNLSDAPDDWPEKLYPGSLNVLIANWPEPLADRNLEPSAKSLDNAGFTPALTIPQSKMGNNKLMPTSAMPHRGTAQIWRSILHVNEQEISCWVLRRFGSGLSLELEIVSEFGLRGKLGLSRETEWPAWVHMFGEWRA